MASFLIACEYSATVRDALRARGHEAISCDLLPTEGDPRYHIQGDAIEAAYSRHWDGMIAHPVCRFLANSGAKHLYIGGKKAGGRNEQRWKDMHEGAAFYRELREAPIEFKALENPVMHGAAIEATGRGDTRFYHPHYFGDPFFKLTGFEVIGLPHLRRTHFLEVPRAGTAEHRKWSKCHRMAPGDDRAHKRSRFEPGFAAAIAEQWGDFVNAILQARAA